MFFSVKPQAAGRLRLSVAVLTGLHLVGLVGCDSGPATYTVKGVVSYQGKPVTGGLINFKPASGRPLGGGIRSDGSYGIPEGLVFSFPLRSDGAKWEIVQGLELDDFARGKIEITRKELEEEKEITQHLLG